MNASTVFDNSNNELNIHTKADGVISNNLIGCFLSKKAKLLSQNISFLRFIVCKLECFLRKKDT